jgi:hypothetical protein
VGTSHYCVDFEASKDDTTVFVHGGYGDTEPSVYLLVAKGLSPAVVVAVASGLLGGGLAGWLVAAWTVQRYRPHRPGVRAAMPVLGFPALLAAMVNRHGRQFRGESDPRPHVVAQGPPAAHVPADRFPPLTLTIAGAAGLALTLAALPLPTATGTGDASRAR